MNRLILQFLFSIFPVLFAVKVQLSTGIAEGKIINATYSPYGNQSGWAFMGLPYARPPVGKLRFKKSEAPLKWQGVLKADRYKPACMSDSKQTYKNENGGEISEDCLYLNVFTNNYCLQKGNCSVMIVVHGGGFVYESASAFDPQILINNFVGQGRNIVVVTINYRLGIFGFGQLVGFGEEEIADRNTGISDVIDSIKWTRREIAVFGGSKDRITLAGHSAGALLTALLGLSPISKGLIQQQIIMSAPLIAISKKGNYKASRASAIRLGCLSSEMQYGNLDESHIRQVYDCLRRVTSEDLLEAQLYVIQNSTFRFGPPMVDGVIIPDYPEEIARTRGNTKINTMIGTVTAEIRDSLYCQNEKGIVIEERLNQLCSYIGNMLASQDPARFVESCVENYSKPGRSQFLSDELEFYWGALQIASSHLSPHSSVFLYSYSYSGAGNAFNKYIPTIPSPMHSEDLIYVFGTHRKIMQPKDYEIERIYTQMFANFVNFADPSPSNTQKWERFSEERKEYFHIDFNAEFQMPGNRNNYYNSAEQFWNRTIPEIRRMEQFADPLDSIWTASLIEPIQSHLENQTASKDKSLQIMETIYWELERFMAQINNQQHFEQLKLEENPKGLNLNILLLILSGTIIITILFFFISKYLNRRKSGYQLLE